MGELGGVGMLEEGVSRDRYRWGGVVGGGGAGGGGCRWGRV